MKNLFKKMRLYIEMFFSIVWALVKIIPLFLLRLLLDMFFSVASVVVYLARQDLIHKEGEQAKLGYLPKRFYSRERNFIEQILNSDQNYIHKLLQIVILVKKEENRKGKLTGAKIANYVGISVRHFRRVLNIAYAYGAVEAVYSTGKSNRYKIFGPVTSSSDTDKLINPDEVYPKLLDSRSFMEKLAYSGFMLLEIEKMSHKNWYRKIRKKYRQIRKKVFKSNFPIDEGKGSEMKYSEFAEFVAMAEIGNCFSLFIRNLPVPKELELYISYADIFYEGYVPEKTISESKSSVLSKIIDTDLGSLEKMLEIVLVIKDQENKEGELTGSRLAKYIGCSERQVRRLIKKTKRVKIIRGQGRTNRYKLPTFDNLDSSSIWSLKNVDSY